MYLLSSDDSQEVVVVKGRDECGVVRVEGCKKEVGKLGSKSRFL